MGYGLGQGTYTQVLCPREMLGIRSCHNVGLGAPEAPSHGSARELCPWGQGDVLQQKLSPSRTPLSPPCAWDPSKFLVLHRMPHGAQVAPASVCGPANGPKLPQTDCGEAPGVVAQCGGSAVGGTGLPPLSVLPCGCVSAWLGFELVPAGSETRAAPKMGCARGCSSDGNSQESGFL